MADEASLLTSRRIKRKDILKKNAPLLIMLIIPILYFAVFCYGPMFGLVMSFQNYRLRDGILGSEWVGLMNFKMIFSTPSLVKVIWNTVRIGLMTVLVSFPFPIILAIMLNEVKSKGLKKSAQTILYLPQFFSWVIVGGIVVSTFSLGGPVNGLVTMLGGEPIGFMTNTKNWLGVYLGAGI